MYGNDSNCNRIHDPPTKEKQIAMKMTQEIAQNVYSTFAPNMEQGSSLIC